MSRDAGELRGVALRARAALARRPGRQRPAGVRPLIAAAWPPWPGGPHAAQTLSCWPSCARIARAASSLLLRRGGASQEVRQLRSARPGRLPLVGRRLVAPGLRDQEQRLQQPRRDPAAPTAVPASKDQCRGMMSLGRRIRDRGHGRHAAGWPGRHPHLPGHRAEPVTLWLHSAQGPFTLIGLRRLRERAGPEPERHCDFDLRGTGLAEAQYLKEGGQGDLPCLSGGTITEGADVTPSRS